MHSFDEKKHPVRRSEHHHRDDRFDLVGRQLGARERCGGGVGESPPAGWATVSLDTVGPASVEAERRMACRASQIPFRLPRKGGFLKLGGGLRPPLLLSLQHQQKRPQIGVRHRGYVVPREHEKIPFREIGGRPEGKGHYCQTTRSRGASQLPLVVWRWDYTTAGFLPFICSYIRKKRKDRKKLSARF
jgi:hypothetical protein